MWCSSGGNWHYLTYINKSLICFLIMGVASVLVIYRGQIIHWYAVSQTLQCFLKLSTVIPLCFVVKEHRTNLALDGFLIPNL